MQPDLAKRFASDFLTPSSTSSNATPSREEPNRAPVTPTNSSIDLEVLKVLQQVPTVRVFDLLGRLETNKVVVDLDNLLLSVGRVCEAGFARIADRDRFGNHLLARAG